MPSLTGGMFNGTLNNLSSTPRRRLADLVTPEDNDGRPNPDGSFVQSGATTIYREQGSRLIAVKFDVVGRDLASTVREAREKTAPLFQAPYRAEWSGEFQEMQEAEVRLLVAVALSLGADSDAALHGLPLDAGCPGRAVEHSWSFRWVAFGLCC